MLPATTWGLARRGFPSRRKNFRLANQPFKLARKQKTKKNDLDACLGQETKKIIKHESAMKLFHDLEVVVLLLC